MVESRYPRLPRRPCSTCSLPVVWMDVTLSWRHYQQHKSRHMCNVKALEQGCVFACECLCGRRCCLPSWHAGHLGGSHLPASLVLVGITGGSGGSPCLPLRFNIKPWIYPNPVCPNLACHNNSSFSGLERLWLFLSSNDKVILRSLFFSQLWAWFEVNCHECVEGWADRNNNKECM